MNACRLSLALLLLAAGGCASRPFSSKWAMKDADYAQRYSRPYPEGERYRRMAKQMVDARHVEGKGGFYLGGAAQADPFAAGGEVGGFYYPYSWLEGRLGLATVVGADANDDPDILFDDAFIGLNTGLRVQSPSRFAPFVGTGLFAGYSEYEVLADADGLDNDGDFFIDDPGETDDEHAILAAWYPEVGAHVWINSRLRVTGSASYFITTEGRGHDFWFFGLSLAWLNHPVASRHDFHVDEPIHRLPSP